MPDLFKAFEKQSIDVLMAHAELRAYLPQQSAHLLLRHRLDPGEDAPDPSVVSGVEWPQEHAGLIGPKNGWIAADVDRLHNREHPLIADNNGFLKTRDHVLRAAHFRERKQKSQRRFRTLISVDPVHM
jgi:hypothetical protein